MISAESLAQRAIEEFYVNFFFKKNCSLAIFATILKYKKAFFFSEKDRVIWAYFFFGPEGMFKRCLTIF